MSHSPMKEYKERLEKGLVIVPLSKDTVVEGAPQTYSYSATVTINTNGDTKEKVFISAYDEVADYIDELEEDCASAKKWRDDADLLA